MLSSGLTQPSSMVGGDTEAVLVDAASLVREPAA
jgi:hypothetical protein